MNLNHGMLAVCVLAVAVGCGTADAETCGATPGSLDYSYNVNFAFGSSTITGQIVLNCDSGTVYQGDDFIDNIVSWSFHDSNGTSGVSSDQGSYVVDAFGYFTATPTTITWSPVNAFNSNGGYILFGDGNFTLDFVNSGNPPTEYPAYIEDSSSVRYDEVSSVTIATSAVPEPSTIWLVLAGFLPLGLIHWRRRMKVDWSALPA